MIDWTFGSLYQHVLHSLQYLECHVFLVFVVLCESHFLESILVCS